MTRLSYEDLEIFIYPAPGTRRSTWMEPMVLTGVLLVLHTSLITRTEPCSALLSSICRRKCLCLLCPLNRTGDQKILQNQRFSIFVFEWVYILKSIPPPPFVIQKFINFPIKSFKVTYSGIYNPLSTECPTKHDSSMTP